MIPVSIPAVRPFEVWFKPEDGIHLPARTPLRIGTRLAHYEDALSLATAAARELPAYGVKRGSVMVIWHASILKVLNTVPLPGGLAHTQAFPLGVALGKPHQEVARLVLEDVRQLTSMCDPLQFAPLEWIEQMHAVLRVVASPEDQHRLQLDVEQTVTMEALFHHSRGVLNLLDQQAAAQPGRAERAARIQPIVRDSL